MLRRKNKGNVTKAQAAEFPLSLSLSADVDCVLLTLPGPEVLSINNDATQNLQHRVICNYSSDLQTSAPKSSPG